MRTSRRTHALQDRGAFQLKGDGAEAVTDQGLSRRSCPPLHHPLPEIPAAHHFALFIAGGGEQGIWEGYVRTAEGISVATPS